MHPQGGQVQLLGLQVISPHPQPATTGFTLKEIEISPKKARLENKHNFFIDYPFDYGMMQSNAPVQRRTAQRVVRCNRLLADQPINIFHSTNGESKSVASTITSGSALNMAIRSPCNLTAASRTPVSMNRNFRQLQTRS